MQKPKLIVGFKTNIIIHLSKLLCKKYEYRLVVFRSVEKRLVLVELEVHLQENDTHVLEKIFF